MIYNLSLIAVAVGSMRLISTRESSLLYLESQVDTVISYYFTIYAIASYSTIKFFNTKKTL